jgi:hypothetical protein
MQEQTEQGQWAIIQLFGHKTLAGLVSKSEMLGQALLRIDVPATTAQPAFTQLYGDKAIYSVTFVSEEVAHKTAEAVQMNPINVYVPDLITVQRHEQEVADLRRQLSRVTRRGYLEDHGEDFGEDEDEETVRSPF